MDSSAAAHMRRAGERERGRDLDRYREAVHAVLGPLIPRGAPLALLDFPQHRNVGDSAIWLGEMAYLQRHHPRSPILWASDSGLMAGGAPPVFPPDTVILIHGGGNFGDLWPHHQRHREAVVAHYRRHRIVQLPQSLHFADPDRQARCATVLAAHPDVHLLVRDRESLEVARQLQPTSSALAPDMALCLGALQRPGAPRRPCLALLRDDREAVTEAASAGCCPVADWADRGGWPIRSLADWSARYPRRLAPLRPAILTRLAHWRVRQGCRLLASARLLICDRLHAHLLCTLMGIPHLLLDNSYRKIARFRALWGTGEGLCRVAKDLAQAERMAARLLADPLRESLADPLADSPTDSVGGWEMRT